MTAEEIVTFIINRWRLEHTAEAIMMALIMQRVPAHKNDVLRVVRRYCDATTENATYRSKGRLD